MGRIDEARNLADLFDQGSKELSIVLVSEDAFSVIGWIWDTYTVSGNCVVKLGHVHCTVFWGQFIRIGTCTLYSGIF